MLCALVLSGFDSSKFAFFGFLSEKSKERNIQLKQISQFAGTSILYSSKHNINDDLSKLRTSLNDRPVCVINEISKLFEKKLFFNLNNAVIEEPAGEYVIVLGAPFESASTDETVDIISEVNALVADGMSVNDACKSVAKSLGMSKRDVYNEYVKMLNN